MLAPSAHLRSQPSSGGRHPTQHSQAVPCKTPCKTPCKAPCKTARWQPMRITRAQAHQTSTAEAEATGPSTADWPTPLPGTPSTSTPPDQPLGPGTLLVRGSTPGVAWRVRPFRLEDRDAVTRLQTEGFFQSWGAPLIDRFMYGLFEAEVRDALRQKIKYNSPSTFTMLVAERVPLSELEEETSQDPAGPSAPAAPGAVVGVVEVSLGSQSEIARELRSQAAAAVKPTTAPATSAANSPQASSSGQGAAGREGVAGASSTQQQQQQARYVPVLGDGDVETVCYVSSMAVSSSERRQGLASGLLEAAELQAAIWRANHLALYVYEDNAPAVNLYRKFGLRQVSASPSWMKLLGNRVRLLMHKPLDPAPGGDRAQ